MSNLAAEIAQVMAAATRAITQLSNDEIKALLAGEGTIQFVPSGYAITQPTPPAQPQPSERPTPPAQPQPPARPTQPEQPKLSARTKPGPRARSAVRPKERVAAERPTERVAAEQVRAHLRSLSDEAEAAAYLKGLGLTVAELKALAGELGVRPTKSTNAVIVADLVKVFVTGRLTTQAVRRF